MPEDGRALLAQIDGAGASFATVSTAEGFEPRNILRYEASGHPTFTGALQHYAGEHCLPLTGRQLAISVAGTLGEDVVRVTNGRWFLSISGIALMMKRTPVVINDVSAIAWATLSLPASARLAIGSFTESPARPARRVAVIRLGAGLGAACLGNGPEGRVYVQDGEAGHTTCSATTPEEQNFVDCLASRYGHVSFERALIASSDEALLATGLTSERRNAVRAGLLGSFAGNIALAFGAWDGVFITGAQAATLTAPELVPLFRERLAAKGRYRRMLSHLPVWRIDRPDLVLRGAAARIAVAESAET